MSDLSPIQPQLLSRINEALVLRTVRQDGPSTRGELSQRLRVSFPTVAKAVGSLLDARLLEEFDDVMSGPGRPAKRLRLANESAKVIGVTIDGLRCEVAAAGFDGVIRQAERRSFVTPPSYDDLLTTVARHIREVDCDEAHILCVGISVGGLIDYRRNEVRMAANLPFLSGQRFGEDLNQLIDAPCALVHDTHALCLSEYVYGEAADFDSFAMLDLCTGIGLGVMTGGAFLTGHSGFAGELGHIPIIAGGSLCRCGRRGCLETFASEWTLIDRLSRRLERPVELEEVISLALTGDKTVRGELARLGKYTAFAIAHVLTVFNPQCLYLSGRLFDELPSLREHVIRKASQHTLEPVFADCRFLSPSGGLATGAVATAISAVTSSRVGDLHDTLSGITSAARFATM